MSSFVAPIVPLKPCEVKSEPIEQRVERRGGGGREGALEDECYSAALLQTKLEATARVPLSPFVVVDL